MKKNKKSKKSIVISIILILVGIWIYYMINQGYFEGQDNRVSDHEDRITKIEEVTDNQGRVLQQIVQYLQANTQQ